MNVFDLNCGEKNIVSALPLVKLSVLRPFAQELRDRGIAPETVFEGVGLTEAAIQDGDLSVHVMVINQFIENSAEAAKDPFLGAYVGGKLDLDGWPPLADADARAKTVGDYLSIFTARANEVANSSVVYLNISGEVAVFGEKRAFCPTIPPAQNDAFMVALGWAVLRRALHGEIDPTSLTVVVSDPKVLPPEFDLMHPMRGDRMGFSIRFPSRWLSNSLDDASATMVNAARPDADVGEFIHSFRQMIRTHIGQGALSATDCAELASMSPQKLKRRLASFGTDTTSEIDVVRQEYARKSLSDTDRSIADISDSLGFTDSANFARSFRRANGLSPTQYRKSTRNQDRSSEG